MDTPISGRQYNCARFSTHDTHRCDLERFQLASESRDYDRTVRKSVYIIVSYYSIIFYPCGVRVTDHTELFILGSLILRPTMEEDMREKTDLGLLRTSKYCST